MNVRYSSPSLRYLLSALAVLAASAAAADRCVAPFKTLSSDCRDANYGANVLCVVIDQSASQPSPCETGSVQKRWECASSTGLSCDLLTYKVNYTPTQARFHITFFGEASDARELSEEEDALEPATSAPPRPGLDPTSSISSSGSGSGDTLKEPPLGDVIVPPETPRATFHNGALVDYTATPKPSTHDDVDAPSPSADTPTESPFIPEWPDWPDNSFGGAPTPPVAGFRGDDVVLASERNEFVDAIGVLRLNEAITEVKIVGGTMEFGTRGKAVQLSTNPQMLTQSPQVTSVSIVNCNLGDQLATGNVLGEMPAELTDLNLRNTMMRAEPSDLSKLQNLKSLQMDQNYLSMLSSNVFLPTLTMLDVSENALTSFEANLPVLESLYLNKNNFNRIPKVVFSMNKLQELYLAENPIVALVVSTSEYDFLTKLRLKIDSPPSSPPPPVVFVPGPVSGSLPTTPTGLVLNRTDIDLGNAVAVPVGNLVDLQGFPVWRLPDAVYEAFQAQQDVISQSTIIIGGAEAQSYQAKAADLAMKASSTVPASTLPLDKTGLQSHRDVLPGEPTNGKPSSSDASSLSPTTSKKDPTTAARDSPTLDSQNTAMASSKKHTVVFVSLGIVVVIATVAIAFTFMYHRRRSTGKAVDAASSIATTPCDGSSTTSYHAAPPSWKPKSSRGSIESNGATFVATHGTDVENLFSSRRIRAAELEDVRVIGAGSSGIVWLVKWRRSRLLAAKRLIDAVATNQRLAEFVSEIVIAADLDHPSIVPLVGIAWTNETDLQALFEFMPNRDLQTNLHSSASDSLSWPSVKIKLATEIVEALVYTHSFSPPLLHRDLRTRNVLLDEDMNAKLSNFGSARFASEQNTMTTNGIGSGRWLAPEILSGSTDYDSASDIYAFGVLLCELDTHLLPYEGDATPETALLERVARGELRPRCSADCPPPICELARRCLAQDPHSRPSAVQVAYELRLVMRGWMK